MNKMIDDLPGRKSKFCKLEQSRWPHGAKDVCFWGSSSSLLTWLPQSPPTFTHKVVSASGEGETYRFASALWESWILVRNENWYCDIIEIERRLIKVVSWEQSEKIIFHNAHHTHQVLRINLVDNTHRVKNRQPSQTPYSPYNYPTGVQVHFSNKLRWCLKNISPAYLEIWKVWLLAIGRLAAYSFSTGSLFKQNWCCFTYFFHQDSLWPYGYDYLHSSKGQPQVHFPIKVYFLLHIFFSDIAFPPSLLQQGIGNPSISNIW